MTAYTLAGALSSALVGAAIGGVGGWLPAPSSSVAAGLAIAVALLALARETGLAAVPFPQIGRQTNGDWAKVYGARPTAILWGLDVGLGFSTWLNFAGYWVLAVVAVLAGSPVLGIALFTGYWFGRVLSVWLGPLLMETPLDVPRLMVTLARQKPIVRVANTAALVVVIGLLARFGLSGIAI